MVQPAPISRRGLLIASALVLAGCGTSGTRTPAPPAGRPSADPRASARPLPVTSDPRVIAARATVPVLCWHQLRDWRASDTSYDRQNLICPPAAFRGQLDALQRGGYTTITPDDYLEHLIRGAALPPKPVLLTFDDAQGSQTTVGFPELQRRRMRATFFLMTVVLGKRNWMSREDVRRLDRAGMTVAAHTYDHQRADEYRGEDWHVQLGQPRRELETLIGKPVRHFAYPYGAWSADDFPHLAQAGYTTAFQLADQPMDPTHPLYTLRRQLAISTWTGPQLLARLADLSRPAPTATAGVAR